MEQAESSSGAISAYDFIVTHQPETVIVDSVTYRRKWWKFWTREYSASYYITIHPAITPSPRKD